MSLTHVLSYTSAVFLIFSMFFKGCEAASVTAQKVVGQHYVTLFYLSLVCQFLSCMFSPEFWAMNKAMRYANTQAFGLNGGKYDEMWE